MDLRDAMRVTPLGVRGSFPVEGEDFAEFGGGTSCMRVEAKDTLIFLDAGTGMVNTKAEGEGEVHILLTHFHCDHIQGMPAFCGLAQKGRPIHIYAVPTEGVDAEGAFERTTAPPLWPLRLKDFPADVHFHDIEADSSFDIGCISVSTMQANHPNGCTIYKLAFAGRQMVYATDFEHNGTKEEELAEFSAGVDVLFYDAQYLAEEYPRFKGYGHSTPDMGLQVAKKAGVGRLLFTHHAPWRTDAMLRSMEEEARKVFPNASYARAGVLLTV